ncbi:MAG: cell division protein FtsL [Pelagibacterales bacterium MED-G41]|nr:MAG: cell division protein FtsL [Pelagibacterales bacterium MED-G41]|tara:strand:- start:241 stop:549 length:309 start_codon:yes stop_codon:yes gene_type:complete
MKKISMISLILFLILFTAVIKNSTKRIEDKIFESKENLRSLKINFENIKLEHNYLSSADKLLEFNELYFENKLVQKNIKNIKIIYNNKTQLKLEENKFAHEK